MKPDHERVSKLLLDTVTLLCKNGLTYETELKIQGLLAITLDTSEVFVVHINESFGGGADSAASTHNDRDCVALSSDAERPPQRKRHAPSQDVVVDLTRLVETPDIRPARLALPSSSGHSDGQRRQRTGAPSQQRNQNQMMPTSSHADASHRMLPPQGVPSSLPRHDGSLMYQLPAVPAARNSAMNPAGSERFPNASIQVSRQQHPNHAQVNSTLREDDPATRLQAQRIALENRRVAAARMAAIQQRHGVPSAQGSAHQNSTYGVSGSMPGVPGNYPPMMTHHRQRNPVAMQSMHQPQQAPVGSGPSLSYQYHYPANQLYEAQSRMMQPASHVSNAIPNLPMLSEHPRHVDSSNPVQQLMLEYERLGQQYQSNSRGPVAPVSSSFHMSAAMCGGNYPPGQAQKEQPSRSLPGVNSEQRRPSTHANTELALQSDTLVVVKECTTSSNNPSTGHVRKSSRGRVEHIDLSEDIDDDDLQQTLQSGLSSELLDLPASSIVIQPDDIDAALDAVAAAASQFETSSSTNHDPVDAACVQQAADKSNANPEYITMSNVQEILPLAVLSQSCEFDLPNDTSTDGRSQSPRVPAVLSDSGRSTGSERMDCVDEALSAQLDGCIDESVSDADRRSENCFQSSSSS